MMEKVSEKTKQPSPQTKIEVFTDGNDDYTYVLPDYYADTCIDYGQLVKIRENRRVVRKEKRTIYGNPNPGDIETTDVENYNGIIRERVGRVGAEDKMFLETEADAGMFAPSVSILLEFHKRVQKKNFPRNAGRIDGSPVWTWYEFFYFQLTILE